MLIGLDGLPLISLKTGVGHYTFELAQSLAAAHPIDEFQLISPFDLLDLSSGAEWHQHCPPNLHSVSTRPTLLNKRWWAIGLPLYAKRHRLTLFHGTNYDVPLWGGTPTVLTIHDLSSLLWPDVHEKKLVRRARRRLPLMARAATMIITPTESVKREVCTHLAVQPGKVTVVPEAARPIFQRIELEQAAQVRKRLGVKDDFLLFVGTIEPRKNLITLVRAFEEVVRTTPLRPQLVVAGKEGWLVRELFDYIKKSSISDYLLFTGYLTDADLAALYSSCKIFIYPSLYEGFGLPPLEAMACGAPVLTSQIPSIQEVVGEAACLVEPTNVERLSESIIELLTDAARRRWLSHAGTRRSAQFSWQKAASLTFEVYREAIRRKGKNAAF